MTLTKIREWRELVSVLKQQPSFGFHGTKIENLSKIMNDIEGEMGVWGHYLGCVKSDKLLSDEKFYEKIGASIHLAKGYSQAYTVENTDMIVKNDLLVILGISDHEMDSKIGLAGSNIMGETFGIGHDMGSSFKFYPIILPKDELETISEKADKKKKDWKPGSYRNLSFAYYVATLVDHSLLSKINNQMKFKSNTQFLKQ